MKQKMLAKIVNIHSCPNCGNNKFFVKEAVINEYLINKDGELKDSREVYNNTIGVCLTCGNKYKMMPTSYGFIPMTGLRQLLFTLPQEDKEITIKENGEALNYNPMDIRGESNNGNKIKL